MSRRKDERCAVPGERFQRFILPITEKKRTLKLLPANVVALYVLIHRNGSDSRVRAGKDVSLMSTSQAG